MRILSDLHLGHRVSRIDDVESLRPLLAGAGTVIFNGDTWQELAKSLRADASKKLEALQRLCAEEGCEAIFLPGNHDPGWPGQGYVELAGGKIVITHGDALFYGGSPWKPEILSNQAKLAEIWARHPAAASDIGERLKVAKAISSELPSKGFSSGRKIWQRAMDAFSPPMRGVEMLKAWFGQAAAGADFCDRYFPAAEFLFIGHFHWGGRWKTKGRRIINTGSFLNPGRAYWAEIANGEMTYGVVEEKDGRCGKGKQLERWRI